MGALGLKRGALGLFFLFLGVCAQAEETEFVIPIEGVKGIDTFHAPQTLPNTRAQDARNIVFDQGNKMDQREGRVTYLTLPTSAPVRNLFTYKADDGTDYLVPVSSGSMYAYDLSTTTLVLSGLNPDNDLDCVQGGGDLWCVDVSSGLFYTDMTTVTFVAAGPHGSLIDWHRNRVVVGNVSGAQSSLYLSGQGHGDDWVTGTLSTSAVVWPVGGSNDARNQIKCLKAGFADFLFVGTEDSSWGFFGNDQRNFDLSVLFTQTGCVEDRTVQEHINSLTWMSKYGLERFDRNKLFYPRVSEQIKDLTDQMLAAGGSDLSWIQTTQNDFSAGITTQTSVSISAGSVVLSTWTGVDSSTSDFSLGTATNMDTTTVAGQIQLSVTDTAISNNSFESGSGSAGYGTIPDNWTTYDTGFTGGWNTPHRSSIDAQSGSYCLALHASNYLYTFKILDTSGNTLYSQEYTAASGAWTLRTVSLTAAKGRYVYFQFQVGSGDYVRTGSTYLFNGTATWYDKGSGGVCVVDNLPGGVSDITSGSFVSRAFDTSFSSAAWLSTTVSALGNGHILSYETQSSSDAANWSSLVAWSSASAPTSDWNRYIRYKITATITSTGTALPVVYEVPLAARASTGTYQSAIKSFGQMSRFGNFDANHTLNDGVLSYYVRTATSSAMIYSAAWVAQTPFTTISASTNLYGQERTEFSITAATQNPTLHDFTFNWSFGGSRPPLVSEVFKDRYHLFYTTNSDAGSYNNMVAPMDRSLEWMGLFDNTPAAAAVVWRRQLFLGDSNATGKIFQMYVGNSDDGSPINSYIKFKDYAGPLDGGNPDEIKFFRAAYLTADHAADPSQNVDLSLTYSIDGSTTSYSLGTANMAENEGRINARFFFPRDRGVLQAGRWISPMISGSGVDTPYTIYGLRLYGLREEIRWK